MSPLVIAILALAVIAVAVAAAFFWRRGSAPPPQPEPKQELLNPDGDVVAYDNRPRRGFALWRRAGRPAVGTTRVNRLEGRGSGLYVALIALLLVGLAFWQLPRLLSNQDDRFLVLVAPLNEPGAAASEAGRTTAQELASALNQASNGDYQTESIANAPANEADALAIMRQRHADVLLWGSKTPGGMIDQNALLLTLSYNPTGSYAPNAWDGFVTRFATPTNYPVASSPINGPLVLPPLLRALASYGAGDFSATAQALDQATAGDSALDPMLPHMLRGNMLWARGAYTKAIDEYQQISDYRSARPDQPQLALLANNLGVIMQDAGDSHERDVFGRAVNLLNGRDLGQLRVNLARIKLVDRQPDEAVDMLRQAQNLLPETAELHLTLADAERQAGNFAQAQDQIDLAGQLSPDETSAIGPELQDLLARRLRANVLEQRGLLQAATALDADGPLIWELQAGGAMPKDQLADAQQSIQRANAERQALAEAWAKRSVALDAAKPDSTGSDLAGLIATGQALRADANLRTGQLWESALELEVIRLNGIPKQNGVAAFFAKLFGDRSPLAQLQKRLTAIVDTYTNDNDAKLLLGRSYLYAGDAGSARKWYDAVRSAEDRNPEAIAGSGLVDELDGKLDSAAQQYRNAINVASDYFPARIFLARLDEQRGDWAAATEQWIWLARNRPSPANSIALAHALRMSKDYARAEQVLAPLAQANNVAALVALGQVYSEAGKPAAAQQALEQAQRVKANDPDVALQLGDLLYSLKDYRGAEEQYNIALYNDPTRYQANLGLAKVYAKTPGKEKAQANQYRDALKNAGTNPAALAEIGDALVTLDELPTAATAYEQALAASNNQKQFIATVAHKAGQVYLKLGRLKEAEQKEQQAIENHDGPYPEALIGLGDIALENNQPDAAQQHFNEALAAGGSAIDAEIGIGRSWAEQGNWGTARAHFQKALELNKTSAAANYWVGEALRNLQQPMDALTYYKQAVDLDPYYTDAYIGAAQIQIESKQYDLARKNLDVVKKYSPNSARGLLLRGQVLEVEGETQAAIDAYSQAIAAESTLTGAYYRRALLYLQTNEIARARTDLQRVIALNKSGSSPEAHYWIGRTYLVDGNYRSAVAEFKTAIDEKDGNYPDAIFYRGIAAEQLGDVSGAVESLNAALTMDGGAAWAGEAQAALRRLRSQ